MRTAPKKYCIAARPGTSARDKISARTVTGKEDACWGWIGYKTPQGYPKMWWRGRMYTVCRVLMMLKHGRISKRTVSMHSCDNPKCVNPNHISIGSAGDNTRQAVSRGRLVVPRGEAHVSSKLTDVAVQEILKSNESLDTIAKQFGVKQSCIWSVKKRKTWKHVSLP